MDRKSKAVKSKGKKSVRFSDEDQVQRLKRPGEVTKKTQKKIVKTKPIYENPFVLKLDDIARQMRLTADPKVSEDIADRSKKISVNHRVWEVMDKYKTTDEVEFRFGLRNCDGSKFTPGISKNSSFILEAIFESRDLESKYSEDTIEIYKGRDGNSLRKIIRDDVESWQEKSQKASYEDSIVGFKIVASTEKSIPQPRVQGTPFVRHRKRHTFTTLDSGSPYYAFQIDMTDTGDSLMELEIEIIKEKFKRVYNRVEECTEHLEQIFEDIMIGISESSLYRLYADERRSVISEINGIFGADRQSKDRGTILPFINKPINLGEREYYLNKSEWYLTEKTDGVRYLLYLNTNGVYLVQEPRSIKKISDLVDLSIPLPVLLEVEAIKEEENTTLTIFDVLSMGKPTWREPFSRYSKLFVEDPDTKLTPFNLLSHVVKHNKLSEKRIGDPTSYILKAKVFYHPRPQSEIQSPNIVQKPFIEAFSMIRKKSLDPDSLVDGVIFQDPGPYITGLSKIPTGTFKWKPANKLSIDFLAKKIKNDDGQYELYFGKGEKFEGTEEYPFDDALDLVDDPEDYDGKIVEVAWDSDEEKFVFLRTRPDKIHPNGRATTFSVWKDMRNPFDPSSTGTSGFRGMRIFHNQIKRNLLQQFLRKGEDLVDFGSGRGGDVGKWADIGLKQVLAIEPDSDKKSEKHVPELRRRIEGVKNVKIHVGEYGAEDHESIRADIEKYSMQPKVFSAFFCLTFFQKDSEEYESLLKTLELIPDNGYFIGTVLNGDKVKVVLDGSKYKSEGLYMKLEDDELTIKMEGTMVDYKEYLFSFEHFRKKMQELGFTQIVRCSLDGNLDANIYEKLNDTERLFSEMNVMFVFQKAKSKVSNHIMSVGSEAVFSQNKVKERYWMVSPYQPLMKMAFYNAVMFCLDPEYRGLFDKTEDRLEAKEKIRSFMEKIYSQEGLTLENWKNFKLLKKLDTEKVEVLVKNALESKKGKTELINAIKRAHKNVKGLDKQIEELFSGSGLRGKIIKNPNLILDTVYGKIMVDSYLKNSIPLKEAEKRAFEQFMAMLDDEECIMTHRSMLGILSKLYKVNILLFDRNSDLYRGKEIPLFNGDYKKTIMLFTPDAEEYYPIKNESDEYIFSQDDPLLKEVLGNYEEEELYEDEE